MKTRYTLEIESEDPPPTQVKLVEVLRKIMPADHYEISLAEHLEIELDDNYGELSANDLRKILRRARNNLGRAVRGWAGSLHAQGYSNEAIAKIVRLPEDTVRKIVGPPERN